MHHTILWTGREYYSLEHCFIDVQPAGVEVTSTIIGHYQSTIYRVEYRIKTNVQWETISLAINARINDVMNVINFERTHEGWINNGIKAKEFDDCIDVDIPLTPFTNTLPIRRLKLETSKPQVIDVIYCDLLEGTIKPVKQKYTRRSATQFHYENVPNDFEATIVVDEEGFVVDYPELFVRTMKR